MCHDGHAKPLLCLPPSLIRNSVTSYTAVSTVVQDIQMHLNETAFVDQLLMRSKFKDEHPFGQILFFFAFYS